MESFEICRVCMEEVKHVWPLFEHCAKIPLELTPATLISECAGIAIDPNDGLPDLVCDSCLEAMVIAYSIRQKCISSDRKLRKILLRSNACSVPQEVKQQEHLTDETVESDRETESCEANAVSESLANEKESSGADEDSTSENAIEIVLKEELAPAYFDEEYLIEATYTEQPEDGDGAEQQIAEDESNDEKLELADLEQYPQHGVEKLFTCEICEKRFATKGNMKAHALLHSNHKPFSCELCGATFAKKHNYNMHTMRHAGNRTHPCPVCEKSFVCAVNLKNHMRIHSSVKPFQCDYCSREFCHRTDKARHEVSHTGEYPYGCEKCQRKFSRNTSLTKHLVKCNGSKSKHPNWKRKSKIEQHTE
ncbi:zinc finger protein 271 [Anopheles gambiae]|uniref:zinc finger protein 271 n=1 Tax=Anopheles gambiae TaxID=7165 RepID=UPI002AC8D0F6|nr:zinc finger protein 271 [Anopheles gambiae]